MNQHDALTPHEIRLLQLFADGHSFQSVAEALGVSLSTVAFYRRSLYAKLGVHSKVAALVYAIRHGLIE